MPAVTWDQRAEDLETTRLGQERVVDRRTQKGKPLQVECKLTSRLRWLATRRLVVPSSEELVAAADEIERLRDGLREIMKSKDKSEAVFLAAVVLGGPDMKVSDHRVEKEQG